MYAQRVTLYRQIERLRSSKVITYVTSDRIGMQTQIADDAFDLLVNHLDQIGDTKRISLIMYTRGGNTLSAWGLINLIRLFCNELEIIIPSKCHSAGTLMSLGANRIIMTKQATLGPIDPSLNSPLNPQTMINGQMQTQSVSVEDVKGFISIAKKEFGIEDGKGLADILVSLGDKVHPLVLGNVYRAQSQIQMLATKLLANQINDDEATSKIVSFLCSESGSHDYTINRNEALELGLKIEKPDDELYQIIKAVYEDLKSDMQLSEPFNMEKILGGMEQVQFTANRVFIESTDTHSDVFVSEGDISRITDQFGNQNIIPNVHFEGWRNQ